MTLCSKCNQKYISGLVDNTSEHRKFTKYIQQLCGKMEPMDHQSSLNTKSAANGQQAKQSTTPAPSISISGGGAYPPPSLAARQNDNEASLPKGTSAVVG